jgi:hypothetical protein
VYGTLGSAAANNVPGSRWNATTWTDSQGHLWLFGGNRLGSDGARGYLNDLWEFDPATTEWMWRSGSSSTGNQNCFQTNDECARPATYGTLGQFAAGNVPSGRNGSSGGIDEGGDLLLFGGANNANGVINEFNDLWAFHIASGEWAWIAGSNQILCGGKDKNGNCNIDGQWGLYGSLGVPAAGNTPGSRNSAVSWSDAEGNLWLFGGEGFDKNGILGALNDLWAYQRPAPAPDFALAASADALTIKAGGSGSVMLTISPQNGFDSAVSFSCAGLPAGTSCSFSPSSVTPAGGAVTTQLTIAASTSASILRPGSSEVAPAAALVLGGCLLLGWTRRRGLWLGALLVLAGVAGLSACSSVSGLGTQPPPTPQPTVATVTITAVSGAITRTATLTLTVNH